MIISDDDLEQQFVGTDFGTRNHRKLVEQAVLKRLTGYYNGSTITGIIKRLGLVDDNNEVTERGKHFAWASFADTCL